MAYTVECFGGPYDGQTWAREEVIWTLQMVSRVEDWDPDVKGWYVWILERRRWEWRVLKK